MGDFARKILYVCHFFAISRQKSTWINIIYVLFQEQKHVKKR